MKHEEHRTPDGALTLVVSHEDDDITIGFDGFQWHTHGDVLAATYQLAGATDLTPGGRRSALLKTSFQTMQSLRW